jgi:hypothetical protein
MFWRDYWVSLSSLNISTNLFSSSTNKPGIGGRYLGTSSVPRPCVEPFCILAPHLSGNQPKIHISLSTRPSLSALCSLGGDRRNGGCLRDALDDTPAHCVSWILSLLPSVMDLWILADLPD